MADTNKFRHQNGFTLIEVIATLVIMGVIGLGISVYFIHSVQGFLLARAGSKASQKVTLAMERLAREIKQMDTVLEAGGNRLRYRRGGTGFGIARVGSDLKLIRGNALPSQDTGAVLIDNISGFSLNFLTDQGGAWTRPADNSLTGLSRVSIRLTMDVFGISRTFDLDINPLYNNTVNGSTS